MKTCGVVFLLIIAICAGACAPRAVIPTAPAPLGPAQELFSQAESRFNAKAYSEAMALYQSYLERYPQDSRIDAAMMKLGAIHSALGDSAQARQNYERLIAEKPESPFAADARVEVLAGLYNEGRYDELIQLASEQVQRPQFEVSSDKVDLFRTYALLGDAYLALGTPTEAVLHYAAALEQDAGREKEVLRPKLTEAASQLASEEIIELRDRVDDWLVLGYLSYQLGVNYARAGKYDDALQVLADFRERFPDSEHVPAAVELMAEINNKSTYQRTTVGCLLPLSGPYQAFGYRALRGIELALHRFAAQAELPDLKLVVKDTGSDPQRAVRGVAELADRQVALIIGPIITADAAASEAQQRGIPIITLTQKSRIPEIGDFVFRNFITPRMQVKALVAYAVRTLGLYRYAIVYPEENYGTTFMNLFWDELLAHGASVVGIESYRPDQTDFADPIKKIAGPDFETQTSHRDARAKAAEGELDPQGADETPEKQVDFDAIFIPDAPKKAGLIIPQLAFYDVGGVQLLGTNLWHSGHLIRLSKQFVQGALMPDGFFAESRSAPVRDFVEDFRKIFSENPAFMEAVAYDTAVMVFQLVVQPEIQFRSALKDALMELSHFQGVTGPTSFDETGEAQKKLFLLQVRGNEFVELEYY